MPKTLLKHNTGLLWMCDDPRKSLEEKISDAALCYESKYRCRPNVCYVHASKLATSKIKIVGQIQVIPRRNVLAHHYWIGVKEQKKQRRRRISTSPSQLELFLSTGN